MLEPGEQIDIWVVEKALGSGGMGSVYRCHNRSATRILAAVKVLDPAVRAASGAQERFIREAEILYQLDHPNIVKVRNIRIDAEMPYLEMEFVEGESLERRLRRGALPFPEALSLMAQLADAVAYMHGRGVCHRDLKPANVLIDPNGRVRVVDFGLALESDRSRLTQAGMTFGTVSYAPPEWATPEQLRPQAWDIYAMGTMFWEMLTGRMAFPMSGQGNPRQQAMQVILHKQDHPPLDPGKRYHTDLRALVGEMTHSDPGARVQDAAEVAARVRTLTPSLAVESGETLTPVFAAARLARPPDTWGDVDSEAPEDPTTLPPTPPPAPAGRRTLWLLALAVPILAAGAGVGLWRLGQLAPPPPPATATTRAVIVATASPPGLPTRFLADGRAVAPDASGSLHLDEVPVGELVLAWVAGEGCGPCPGEGCPAWCGVGNRVVPIPAGEGPLATALQVPPPAPGPVALVLPEGLPGEHPLAIRVDGVLVDLPAEGPAALSLNPGRHALQVDLGACVEEAAGCWPDCPAGCASWTGEAAVPYEGPAPTVHPELGLPAAAATPAPAPRRAGFVTVDAFAAWLATHPEFQAEAARAAGRGDAGYLSGWSGATPPAGAAGPVVRVSGYAAAAYCAGRGGLPPADAALPRPAGAPDLEFRDRGGAVVVLDPEAGVVPTTGRDSNVLTGFRCAR